MHEREVRHTFGCRKFTSSVFLGGTDVSILVPAWGLLQWKITRKTLINEKLTRFEANPSLIERAMAEC